MTTPVQVIDEFDLQPDPRILPMLGEINLAQWRCIAELIDNSVDSFLSAQREGSPIPSPQVHISVPTSEAATAKVTIRDNGPGMVPSTLEKAVRAGWTSNDPMHNLGMFGMGFNIATARLGTLTRVWTTRAGDTEWHGLEIDFARLVQQRHFRTPRLTRPKVDSREQGTEISIERLKPEQRKWFATAANRSKLSRDHFAVVYSALLRANSTPISFELFLNGTKVRGHNHCIWGGEGNPLRQVLTARYGVVSAYQPLDVHLGERNFCLACWQWVPSGDTNCPACASPDNIVTRQRRVRGWLGIQRYVHSFDFGIDLIRNGRKIEIGSKDLFVWDTGSTIEPEYPIDDQRGRGRIVGEIHVDHCRVPYTKDRFDRTDPAWDEMLRVVRGDGPLRPDRAAELGFGPNNSPLFLLFQAFRRNQPHQKVAGSYAKLLAVRDNDQATTMAKKFYAGEAEYQPDNKWWELVEEADRSLLTPATAAPPSTTTPLPGFAGPARPSPSPASTPTPPQLPRIPIPSLTREYQDSGTGQRWNVKAFRVEAADTGLGSRETPWSLRATPGGEHEFLVNDRHEVFRSATMTPLDALLSQLAWSAVDFARGQRNSVSFASVLTALRDQYAGMSKLDPLALSGEAAIVLNSIASSLPSSVRGGDGRVLFDELTPSDQEAIQRRMAARSVSNPQQIIDEAHFLEYAPGPLLVSFFESHADLFFDGQHWDIPFSGLDYGNSAATDSAKAQIVRHYSSLIADAVWLVELHPSELADASRTRLLRAALALDLLVPTQSSSGAS
jgi:hypothetical protein